MTQHSTRATSPLSGASLGSRLPQRSWPVRLVLVAALLLAVPFLFDAGTTVHAADNEITGVTVTSTNPGELAITWDAPSRAPDDYRVTWKKSTARWPSYRNENTVEGGNAFPTGTSHTVSDLEEGTEYSVRVRARYYDANDNLTESGPWSDPPVEDGRYRRPNCLPQRTVPTRSRSLPGSRRRAHPSTITCPIV